MTEHKATILLDDEVIAKDLSVSIETTVSPGGLKDWHGVFELPTGSLSRDGEVHHIVLDDTVERVTSS